MIRDLRALGLGVTLLGCGPAGIADPVAGDDAMAATESGSSVDPTDEPPPTSGDSEGERDQTDDETTGSFVIEWDIICGLPCDPFQQDCPDAEKCVAVASSENWDNNRCVPVTGTGAIGDACVYGGPLEPTDDCDADSACWNAVEVDGVWTGTCAGFCLGSADASGCAEPGATCRVGNDGALALCLPSCDPLLQDCAPELVCSWSDSSADFHCAARSSEWSAAVGQPCGFNNDCDPGSVCVEPDAVAGCMGAACCASYCELGLEPSLCGPNQECRPFFADGTGPAEHADLGVCVAIGTLPGVVAIATIDAP